MPDSCQLFMIIYARYGSCLNILYMTMHSFGHLHGHKSIVGNHLWESYSPDVGWVAASGSLIVTRKPPPVILLDISSNRTATTRKRPTRFSIPRLSLFFCRPRRGRYARPILSDGYTRILVVLFANQCVKRWRWSRERQSAELLPNHCVRISALAAD